MPQTQSRPAPVPKAPQVEAIFPDFHAGYRHAKAKAAPNPAPLDVDPIEEPSPSDNDPIENF